MFIRRFCLSLWLATCLGLVVAACADMTVKTPLKEFSAVKTPLGDFTLGAHRETRRLSREDAVARNNYCPTSGCVVRLDRVEVSPARPMRGRSATLSTTYTILTAEDVAIPVTITREMLYEGKSLGMVKAIDTRNRNGTWDHHLDFSLPPEAAPGSYTLVTRVSTGYGSDQKSTTFSVD